MRFITVLFFVLVGLGVWGGYGGLIWYLGEERAGYLASLEDAEREALRGENAARTRAAIAGTETERAALEDLLNTSVLEAVETIEGAGELGGASNITIGAATSVGAPKGLSAITLVANASGSFATLSRTLRLLETLPIPARVERFELSQAEGETTWNLTAHVRVTMNPSN